jgi:hypothetical protein
MNGVPWEIVLANWKHRPLTDEEEELLSQGMLLVQQQERREAARLTAAYRVVRAWKMPEARAVASASMGYYARLKAEEVKALDDIPFYVLSEAVYIQEEGSLWAQAALDVSLRVELEREGAVSRIVKAWR